MLAGSGFLLPLQVLGTKAARQLRGQRAGVCCGDTGAVLGSPELGL